MMRQFILLLAVMCGLGELCADPQPFVDLRSYITKYSKDGDDTEAFRQALKHMGTYHLRALYLPPGTYHLSDTIDINALSNGEIFGHGYPEIKMKNPGKDIFASRYSWKLRISGISFIGGRNQLAIGNNNIDRTVISISNCKFQKASGFAIHLGEQTASAHVSISDCSFYLNHQALYNHSDWTVLRDSWITTDPKMRDCAVIENYGCLTLDHVLGVPLVEGPRKETKQRWIDHYGLKLTCRDVRFGGEGGGLPIVYNFRQFRWKYPVVRSSILLTDCWLYCAGTEAIRFINVPNFVRIENCTGLVDSRFFTFEPGLDTRMLEEKLGRSPRLVRIETSGTDATFVSNIPQVLQKQVFSDQVTFVESEQK